MSRQFNDTTPLTYTDILEFYQRCRRHGDWAKVYLETQGGREFFTISVSLAAGNSAGSTTGLDREQRRKTKKPSQMCRDRQRRETFLENRRQAATTVEVARNEIREEVQEEVMTVNNAAGETRTVIVGAAAQDDIVRAGGSEEDKNQENGDEEEMIQIDGNVTLTDIVEEETEPPKTQSLSLWMNTKDIKKEELIQHLKNNDILENEYYFSTRDGYFLGWNGRIEKQVRVYGLNVTDFKKTGPKLERMSKTWKSLQNLQVHR